MPLLPKQQQNDINFTSDDDGDVDAGMYIPYNFTFEIWFLEFSNQLQSNQHECPELES